MTILLHGVPSLGSRLLPTFETHLPHGHDTQPGLSPHRREARTEVRPRVLLEGPVVARRAEVAGRAAAPAPLDQPDPARPGAGRRLRVLRPDAGHELHLGQPARARARLPWRFPRQLF